jgi:hypothetical protein
VAEALAQGQEVRELLTGATINGRC